LTDFTYLINKGKKGGRCGRDLDRMVVITTNAISAYHH